MLVVSFLVNPGMLELARPLGTLWEISVNELKAQRDKAYFQSLKTVLVREYLLNLQSKLSQRWKFGGKKLIYIFFSWCFFLI